MSSLYGNELASIYDKIYQGFIDYREEYLFYAGICNQYGADHVLELACGSGNLAAPFSKSFDSYLGVDLSEHMLRLAREKYPTGNFQQGDMRHIDLPKSFGAALITGRSTSYLVADSDMERTFASVYTLLTSSGIFVFDCIDTDKFLPYIAAHPELEHRTRVDEVDYARKTKWHRKKGAKSNLVRWKSAYFRTINGEKQLLGKDDTVFRVFKKAEVQKTLERKGFEVLRITNRKTYAFDTFVVVAKRME